MRCRVPSSAVHPYSLKRLNVKLCVLSILCWIGSYSCLEREGHLLETLQGQTVLSVSRWWNAGRFTATASPSKYLPVESRAGWDFHSLWKLLTSHWERGFGMIFFFPQSGIVSPSPWIFSFLIFVLISDKTPMQQIFCRGAGFPFTISWWGFWADPLSTGLEAAYAGGVDSAHARSGHCHHAIMMWKMSLTPNYFPPNTIAIAKMGVAYISCYY